jgi:hypothetical protein
MATMFIPVILEELQDVPEELVNQATVFMLQAMARVQNPTAQVLVIDLENRTVLVAEPLPVIAASLADGSPAGSTPERRYLVRANEQPAAIPALPDAALDSGNRDGTAATGA